MKFMHDTHGHTSPNGSGPPKDIVGYEVALKEKKQIAEGTYAFVFEKPKGFQYQAGKHIRMTIINPSEEDRRGNSRFFSFVSTPQEEDLVFAMRMTDSAFKRALGKMNSGEKVRLEMRLNNPHGSFALQEDTSKPAVFLIGGIGIIPAYSMIKDAIQKKQNRTIYLFYANRRPEDAPFLAELTALAQKNSSFKLIATMTQPEKSAQAWKGETGKIDQSMIKRYVSDLEFPIYYIAGLSAMVKGMKSVLKEAGVNEDIIRAEEFDGFTMNHNDQAKKLRWTNHLTIIAIVIGVIAFIVLHAGAAVSIYNAGFGAIGIALVIVAIKVFAIFKFKHTVGSIHSRRNH